ncbi:MAG TPA: cytochrome c-type biogenesis protein [Xanthomonadales bacterium]|nr:cytochrome c-type biogenesis protein [Xanthomonadales bacterium]
MKQLKPIVLFLFLACALSLNASEPLEFESAEQEKRFKTLATELRCLVCQNQTISDSDAPLAQDLRQEIYDMMIAGRTDDEIKEFMVARYGDFVLYRPPVQSNTIVLWLMPLLLLLIGGALVFRAVNKRAAGLDDEDENLEGNS